LLAVPVYTVELTVVEPILIVAAAGTETLPPEPEAPIVKSVAIPTAPLTELKLVVMFLD